MLANTAAYHYSDNNINLAIATEYTRIFTVIDLVILNLFFICMYSLCEGVRSPAI